MKTTITSEGALTIKAETQLEAYALDKWCQSNVFKGANMVVDMNVKGDARSYDNLMRAFRYCVEQHPELMDAGGVAEVFRLGQE